MKQEIQFKSGNYKLSGILSNPTNSKENPIVILCHGSNSSKNSYSYIKFEEIFDANNISTFRFDFFGHGQSEGKFENLTASQSISDVENAINLIENSGYQNIILLGLSFGGLASIISASKNQLIKGLILISPVSNYAEKYSQVEELIKKWKQYNFRIINNRDGTTSKLNYSFYEDAIKYDGYIYAKQIKCPTLIIHGNQDQSVPIEQSIQLSKKIQNSELIIMQGTDHAYSNPKDFEKRKELVKDFIMEIYNNQLFNPQ